jgi:thiopurine S-methyltransferase
MDHDFWRQKWEKNEIGFHEGVANAFLVKHFPRLSVPKGARAFLPLCGKTRDMHWLLSQGFRVVGAELSKIAVAQLFAELGVKPDVTAAGTLTRYDAPNITIFQGDVFALARGALGGADAVYDRAALVALPAPVRVRYARHVVTLTDAAPQLLISYAYDQSVMAGPPFSVSNDEVRGLYGGAYDIALLEHADVPGGLKGKCPAAENVWLLQRRTGGT